MYCSSCGEEVADDSAFCRYCGEAFTPESGEGEQKQVERETPTAEPESEEGETSTLKKLGYWGGRSVQVVLVFLAVVFIVGGLSMNVIQFAAIGVLALVLLGFAGVIEVIVVRPSTS